MSAGEAESPDFPGNRRVSSSPPIAPAANDASKRLRLEDQSIGKRSLLVYSTCLGGTGGDGVTATPSSPTAGYGIAVDAQPATPTSPAQAFSSTDFPVTNRCVSNYQ